MSRMRLILLVVVVSSLMLNTAVWTEAGNENPSTSEVVASDPVTTTDKYTYCIGEPVNITVDGFITVSSGTWLSRGYIVKDEEGEWARDPPQWGTNDYHEFDGPIYFTWDQTYDVMFEYDILGNYHKYYAKNGQQVSPGKYYIHSLAPGYVEIEIVECSELTIEKVKISGPDEVFIHSYNEWELKITVTATNAPGSGVEGVTVYDVLPAEFELLEWTASQGTLSITKQGKGKMGSTHLTWDVGYLGCWIGNSAELVLKIATTKNPAGKQEFTSPGVYALNNGATAKGTVVENNEEITAGPTETITVKALDPMKYVCNKNLKYRNENYHPDEIFPAGHFDCAYGWADIYVNTDGKIVGFDSYIAWFAVMEYEQPVTRESELDSGNPGNSPCSAINDATSEDANGGIGIDAMQFIFLAQFSAFGLVAFCYWKGRNRK